MGLNDAAEMLEAAQAENVRLERALLHIKQHAVDGGLTPSHVLEIIEQQAGL